MQTKLTLRLDEDLIGQAKIYAQQKGRSLSQVVADYFRILNTDTIHTKRTPPITASLRGLLKDANIDEKGYREYLEEKFNESAV
ncbi:MAG: DUF6364 family protein [Proteobacteria bacterium]|nr:DUF6364 family protein [Pseudomonadota bacterium]